jgi:hypothetical protein
VESEEFLVESEELLVESEELSLVEIHKYIEIHSHEPSWQLQ